MPRVMLSSTCPSEMRVVEFNGASQLLARGSTSLADSPKLAAPELTL